jgi:DNA-binding response OmpR family regulator
VRVLIVHADDGVRARIEQELTLAGIACEAVAGDQGVQERLEREAFGLILVDRELPEALSRAVFDVLRVHGHAAAILWIGEEEPADLLRRIRSVPTAKEDPTRVVVGDLVVDFLSGAATRAGVALDLTPTEFSILRHLAVHLGSPVSRSDLLATLWGIDFPTGTNVVDVHIRRLRGKLDEPFGSPLVHTVRGSGYMLESRGDAPAAEEETASR